MNKDTTATPNKPERLYFLAATSSAELAACSPASLLELPPKLTFELADIGYMTLHNVGCFSVVRRERLVEVKKKLRLNYRGIDYRLGRNGLYWILTAETLELMESNKKLLFEIARVAHNKIPKGSDLSLDIRKWVIQNCVYGGCSLPPEKFKP